MDRVGVRELRQNLSVYLQRVKAGESLEVTEHGHLVAELRPAAPTNDPVARLIAQGRARPAEADWASLPPPLPSRSGDPYAITKALMADREGKE